MSIHNDAESVAAVTVGGTDRSALIYDTVTKTWYTKNQAGTSGPLVNGVSSFNGRTGAVSPAQADYDGFFLTAAEGNAAYDALGLAAAAQAASQPLDSDLTAIAALTTTSFGRSFLDRADAAAGRTLLALGTAAQNATGDFQPIDSDLTAIAALTTTTYGRSQLALADAAADTAQLNVATTSLKGLMSSADKIKTNNIWIDVVAEYSADKTGATDSRAAIVNAIAAVPTTGGVIYFPAGIYAVSANINVDKPVIFIGAGRSNSFISATAATGNIFTMITGSAGGGFEQLRFWAGTSIASPNTSLRTAGHAVDFGAIANTYMQQCDILFQWSGVNSGGALQFLDDMNIREMGANAASGQCVAVNGTGDRYLRRLTTDNPSDPTTFSAVRVTQCSSLVLTDCNLINGGNALHLVPTGSNVCASILCTQTFFDNSVIGCHIIPGTSATVHRVRFVNCWFGSNTTAGCRMGDGTTPNANIATIEFVGCDFFGESITPFGLDVLGATDWSMRACRVAGHTTNGVRVAVGTGTQDHRFAISDSYVGQCLGTTANAQGITIGAGTYGSYSIMDNRGFDRNTTPGLVDSGVIGVNGAVYGSKSIGDNVGTLVRGNSLPPLASGGGSLLASIGRGVVTSTTVETFMATFRIPANAVQIGNVIKIQCVWNSSAAGIPTVRLRVGTAGTIADALLNIPATGIAGAAGSWLTATAYVYVVALGPTATMYAVWHGQQTATAFSNTVVTEALGNVPTTAAFFLTVTLTTTVASYTSRLFQCGLDS